MQQKGDNTELIRRLEKAKFINLDVTARALVDAAAGVMTDEVDICPPIWVLHRPPPVGLGQEELINAVKTLNESVNTLTQKIGQMDKG